MSQIKKIGSRMEVTPKPDRLGGLIPAKRDDEAVTLGQLNEYGVTGVSYKKYVALISQSGASAPTVVELENTLGGTITWGYSSPGTYTGTLTGAFTNNKTTSIISGLETYQFDVKRTSDNAILIQAFASGVGADNLLTNNTLIITVYN